VNLTPQQRANLETLDRRMRIAREVARTDRDYWHDLNDSRYTLDDERHEIETANARRDLGVTGAGRLAFDRLPRDADAEEVSAWADRRASAVARIVCREPEPWAAYAGAANYARRFNIEPPQPKDPDAPAESRGPSVASCVRKLRSPRWWRRAGRVAHARAWELREHAAGRVHVHAQPCASDWAVRYIAQRAEDCRQMLLDLVAVNEGGEEVRLSAAQLASLANPEVRRHELLCHVNGLEQIAEQRGDVGVFVTVTLASHYHRRLSRGGIENPRYDGTSTPRDGQAELNRQWVLVRARLAKEGINVYGLRAAEPQHDGTPHWHLLLFVAKAHRTRVCELIRAAALREFPDEPGAQQHRCRVVKVDKRKGSATGYVAKYVSKCVDGHGVGNVATLGDDGEQMLTGTDAIAHAARVTAWARVWGIRQFQFFGTPSRTVYRELRRVREVQLELPLIEPARAAADAGDFKGYVLHQGGVCVPRRFHALHLEREVKPFSALSEFGEYRPHNVRGVGAFKSALVTRPHSWRIEYRPEDEAENGTLLSGPWTRVNNCNRPPAGADESRPPDPRPRVGAGGFSSRSDAESP